MIRETLHKGGVAILAPVRSLLNVPLKDLKTKKNVLIACIVRNGKAIIPGGADSIQAGDVVLVVSAQRRVNGLGDILEETK